MASNESIGMSQDEYRARLRNQFKDRPLDQHNEGWDNLWREKFTPWDRSTPSPALVDTLDQRSDILGPAQEDSTRRRALVPGCGKGYDVLLFASHGYDAFGLDVSPLAVEQAHEQLKTPDLEAKYPLSSAANGRGEAKILLADFFTDSFLSQTGGDGFDVIYDYTFLCALAPDMRPQWAKRMSELLAADGKLICLEFPLGKEPGTGGPPHGLTKELYEELLAKPGEQVAHDASGYVKSNHSAGEDKPAMERVDRWFAERTHEVGKGKDHVSIWRHAQK